MKRLLLLLIVIIPAFSNAQSIKWRADGNAYTTMTPDGLIQYSMPDNKATTLLSKDELGRLGKPSRVLNYIFSPDQSKVLIFKNTVKVWRLNTRGDYWVVDLTTKNAQQLGKSLPAASLMFAKFSPDSKRVAYVSGNNVYSEELTSGKVNQHTTDGTRKHINGTFDWAYEEEFACRDGILWSPDSRQLAFWQVDATRIRDFYMINNTDSVYSRIIPVEYPTAGQDPSPARVGIIDTQSNAIQWVPMPGDPAQHYLPRIEWNNGNELFLEQLNRKQNETGIFSFNSSTRELKKIYTDRDEAWLDTFTPWENVWAIDFRHKFTWINKGTEFLWFSEKDGWRHLYRITKDGKEKLVTPGNFDVMDIRLVDEPANTLYFYASPDNATQKYLYKSKLDGSGKVERVTPAGLEGSHTYTISPNGKFAYHRFANSYTDNVDEWISLPKHKALTPDNAIEKKIAASQQPRKVEFFKVKTDEGVEMDGWMIKPDNFDATKKYPVLFLVYTEPWGANVIDDFGAGDNFLYDGSLAADGYIYMSIDNRGTPASKGRAWRKSIYGKVGQLNISDQAAATREILKWNFVDAERIAVWGWSGGGSATLNLMFQYPDIYKTGIAVAAVANQLTYDNIYQERYMGLPQENLTNFIKGSPIAHAKNLKGNLLYIHGTGDDNVHYANAEMLINELVKQGKQFQLMIYPNRTHSISEGEGTTEHLSRLYTDYLKKHCPGGPR